MGAVDGDDGAVGPAHQVKLNEFWIGKYEVTNGDYRRFRAGHEGDADLPATGVSWNDAKTFCESLGFRLPTEAEWEYAARAGSQTAWWFGDESKLDRYAWNSASSGVMAHEADIREPNEWDVRGVQGNVWEWVADWYGPFSKEPQSYPTGPTVGDRRVVRAGSFVFTPGVLRSGFQIRDEPVCRDQIIGFRCARSPHRQP